MTDILAQLDQVLSAKSGMAHGRLLMACRLEIADLRKPRNTEWQPIDTLPFPIKHGPHSKTEGMVWLSDGARVIAARPILRHRDGVVWLVDHNMFPTHWLPFVQPAPPVPPAKAPAPCKPISSTSARSAVSCSPRSGLIRRPAATARSNPSAGS